MLETTRKSRALPGFFLLQSERLRRKDAISLQDRPAFPPQGLPMASMGVAPQEARLGAESGRRAAPPALRQALVPVPVLVLVLVRSVKGCWSTPVRRQSVSWPTPVWPTLIRVPEGYQWLPCATPLRWVPPAWRPMFSLPGAAQLAARSAG